MCKIIDSFPKGTDILTRISAVANFEYNYIQNTYTTNCLDLQEQLIEPPNDGWNWQVKYLFQAT